MSIYDTHETVVLRMSECVRNFKIVGQEDYVFYVNGSNGKIVLLDQTGCAWSTEHFLTGADDRENGKTNMTVIQKIPDIRRYTLLSHGAPHMAMDGICLQ